VKDVVLRHEANDTTVAVHLRASKASAKDRASEASERSESRGSDLGLGVGRTERRSPLIKTLPEMSTRVCDSPSFLRRPPITCRKLLLPAPLGPMMAVRRPARISPLTLSMILLDFFPSWMSTERVRKPRLRLRAFRNIATSPPLAFILIALPIRKISLLRIVSSIARFVAFLRSILLSLSASLKSKSIR
jgi:hypothetical protein